MDTPAQNQAFSQDEAERNDVKAYRTSFTDLRDILKKRDNTITEDELRKITAFNNIACYMMDYIRKYLKADERAKTKEFMDSIAIWRDNPQAYYTVIEGYYYTLDDFIVKYIDKTRDIVAPPV